MKRPRVYRIALIQLVVLLLVTTLCASWKLSVAYAFLMGGGLCILPNLYFTFYAFRFMGARSTQRIAQSFKQGLVGKFVLIMVGFACVFALLAFARQHALWVFVGYIAMWLLQIWLTHRAVKHS